MSGIPRGQLKPQLLEAIRRCEANHEPWSLNLMAERFGVNRGSIAHHVMLMRAEGVLREGERLIRTPSLVLSEKP